MPVREMIRAEDLGLQLDPLANVGALSGVRVADVGQGDALCVLDGAKRPVLRIDYGGYQSSPFKGLTGAARDHAIDVALPVTDTRLIMLTHWDEDHWASATPGCQAVGQVEWLVPRQWTSPSAVELSTRIGTIRCIPPALEHGPVCFVAANGDQLWWEKLKPFSPTARSEDCNRTGVAFSVVKAATGQVIFLPGDAPFHLPSHYGDHAKAGLTMRGLVAFHHGARTHWTRKTHAFLERWRRSTVEQTIIYSVGEPNSYHHPVTANYDRAFPPAFFPNAVFRRTPQTRYGPNRPTEILF